MKDINREGILRMIGMRDTAGFMNKINALFLDIYDENGKLAEYSTQLIVTSKNITLLAQRVTDDEQDIANLTVTAQQISASVSSLPSRFLVMVIMFPSCFISSLKTFFF